MIIEQVEALKSWLTTKLSPICDAEPGALAKYVCALVKKDKPEQDLRDICIDQLDVFLQQNTKPFVNDLFEALKTKVYIPPDDKPKPAVVPSVKQEIKVPSAKEKDDPQKKKSQEISSTTEDKENKADPQNAGVVTKAAPGASDSALLRENKDSGTSASSVSKEPVRDVRDVRDTLKDGRDRDRAGSRDRRDSWRDERNRGAGDNIRDARDIIRENREKDKDKEKDGRGDTREVREPRDRMDNFRDRDRDFRRRRTRSRSFSPRRRDFDDRPGRRRFDERPSRFSPDRRWGRRRSWSRSPRRNRSPLDGNRGGGRARSRSPRGRASRSPRGGRVSRSPVRSYRPRSRTRSRSPRPRSWSRPGSGGMPGRLRSRSPSNSRLPDSRGSTPLQDNDFISSSTNDTQAVSSTVPGPKVLEGRLGEPGLGPGIPSGGTRARCQNFEEKGFCMLGDVCPYDHGSDPVVVEDDTIALGPGVAALDGPDIRLPPPSHMGAQMDLNVPPPHVEPYLPEAPGLQVPLRPPFMRGPPPLDLRRPPPTMGGPSNMFPPMQRREVIMGRPGLDDRALIESGGPSSSEPSRIVIPSKRPYSAIDGEPHGMNIGPMHQRMPHQMFGPRLGPPPLQQQMLPTSNQQMMQQGAFRKGFDFNRLGGRGFKHQGPNKPFKYGNVTLEVRKIPPEMNNIAKLNEHFGKFGTLTNIQVKFQSDPGAALISFSTNAEAAAAHRSPEPVFNNRFIKLFWHNAEKPLSLDGEREMAPTVTAPAESEDQQQQQRLITGGRVGDGINHPSLVLPVRPTIPPAHKMTLDNTKGKPKEVINTEPAIKLEVGIKTETEAGDTVSTAATESKSIVYTSSMGNLKKTVFNPTATTPPAAASKVKLTPPIRSPTAVKTADYVSRMEAIKRIEEERKLAPAKQAEIEQKKQELLAKQIEQQKKLLETLEKRKDTMSDAEKQMLRTTLRKISDSIDTVKYGTGAKRVTAAPVAFQQFRYNSAVEQVPSHSSYGRGRGSYGWAPRGGRGRGWASAGISRTNLDKRPRTVEVKGFEVAELDEIRAHFQRFGEIEKEDLSEEVPSAFFTFSMRQSAEMAVAHGGKFKKKTLVVRWNQITPKLSRTESAQSSEVDEDLSVTLDSGSAISTPLQTPVELRNSPLLFTSSGPSVAAASGTSTPTSQEAAGSSIKEPLGESTKTTVVLERSLSDDLLAGEEENFKASYTDDEDDEDHITVTLSNTSANAPTIYTSSGSYGISSRTGTDDAAGTDQDGAGGGETEEDDLSNLEPGPALDFIEEPQL